MHKVIGRYFLLPLSFLSFTVFAEGQWYEGGTLHKADIATWKSASSVNKLATAADWTLISPAVKEKVQSSGNMDTNKPFAQELVTCIDTATNDVEISGGVTDIAASCMVLMGWLK